MRKVVIASAARTPIGNFGGSLKSVPAKTLGAVACEEAIKRAGIKKDNTSNFGLSSSCLYISSWITASLKLKFVNVSTLPSAFGCFHLPLDTLGGLYQKLISRIGSGSARTKSAISSVFDFLKRS